MSIRDCIQEEWADAKPGDRRTHDGKTYTLAAYTVYHWVLTDDPDEAGKALREKVYEAFGEMVGES